MRNLNSKEKELITLLIKNYQPTGVIKIGDIFLNFHKIQYLQRVKPKESEKQCKGILDNRKVKVTYYKYIAIDFVQEFCQSVSLIEFLRENRYIVLSRFIDNDIIGEPINMAMPVDKNGDGKPDTLDVFNNFQSDLWELLSSYYVVTNTLIDFAIDFKTPEKRQYDKTICWTRVAAFISFFGLVISLLLPLSNCTSTRINQNQFDTLKQSINESKAVIPEKMEIFSSDTLNVNSAVHNVEMSLIKKAIENINIKLSKITNE